MSTPPAPAAPRAAPTGEPAAPPAPAPQTPAAPAPAAPAAPAPQEPQDVASLPQWAQDAIAQARQQAAGYRTRAQTAEQTSQATLDRVAQALGLTGNGTPDPAALAEQLTAAQAAQRQQQVENAVLRAAGRLGANPDALLDSRAFAAQLNQLDPAAGDFGTALEAAIKSAVAANTAYSAAPPAPARGGADLQGSGNTGPRQVTEDELSRMTPDEIVQAQNEGRLRALLGG
jgi:hypothetical protein